MIYAKIDKKISDEINHMIDSDESLSLDRVETYIRLKEILQKSQEKKWDISKMISAVGLLFITVIPVVLQWMLGLL